MSVQDMEEVQSMEEGYKQKCVSYALWPLQQLSPVLCHTLCPGRLTFINGITWNPCPAASNRSSQWEAQKIRVKRERG